MNNLAKREYRRAGLETKGICNEILQSGYVRVFRAIRPRPARQSEQFMTPTLAVGRLGHIEHVVLVQPHISPADRAPEAWRRGREAKICKGFAHKCRL
jgi:hypothetical protein